MTEPSRIHRGPRLRLSITTRTLLISAELAAEEQICRIW
jgi:hypothetical protein